MKNYRDQTPQIACVNCNNCFIKIDYDEYPSYFCTDDTDPRPLCGSVAMDENWMSQDLTDAEWHKKDMAWITWENNNRVSDNGICENYEKRVG